MTPRVVLLCILIISGLQAFGADTTKKSYVLENENIKIEIDSPATGGRIISIQNKKGYSFINQRHYPLWRIDLKKIPTEPPQSPTAPLSLDPEQNDGVSHNEAGDSSLLINSDIASGTKSVESLGSDRVSLRWANLDLGEEKGVLDVTVEIAVLPGDLGARFRTKFENRSKKYTVFYLYSPMVSGIYPKNNELAEDYLATPAHSGRLIKNPIANGIFGKKSVLQPNRSSHSMQFDAYTHQGHGLYLAALDGRQLAKRFLIDTDPTKGISWATVHIPNNMKTIPQIWEVPYDTIIGCFQGDWYDACRIYRTWALKQSWAAEGPLLGKKSTPLWFKELDEWMLCPLQSKPSIFDPAVTDALHDLKIGLFLTQWGRGGQFHQKTPDRFPLRPEDQAYLRKAKEAGLPVMAYLQGICWDLESESFQENGGFDHAVRNFLGQNVIWDFSKDKEPSISMITSPGDTWERILGATVVNMAKAGMKAVYLDSNNHGGTYLNFNPAYGTDVGGGTSYIEGNRKFMRKIRDMAREIEPEFCTTAESFWEGNIADLDGFLVSNSTNQFLESDIVTAIPMVPAVYHDYTVLYASWVGRYDLESEHASGYLAKFGMDFVTGIKPGWNQPKHLFDFKNHEIALTSSLLRYRAYESGKKFLVYGEMLRPPVLATSSAPSLIDWYISWYPSSFKVKMPPVFGSMWRAPSGEIGLVLYNWTDHEQTVSVQFRTEDLALESSQKELRLIALNERGDPKKVVRGAGGELSIDVAVPPMAPMVFELSK